MNGNQGSNGTPAAHNGGESAAEDGFDGFTGFSPRKPVKTVIVGSTGRMGVMLLGRARAAGLTVEGVDVPLTPAIFDFRSHQSRSYKCRACNMTSKQR